MRQHALPKFGWALRPYRNAFGFGIVASIANQVLDLMTPLLVAWVIDTVQGLPPDWIAKLLPNSSPLETAIFLSILGAMIFFLESVTQS